MFRVSPASEQDLPAIRALLESSGLPTIDLASACPVFTVVRKEGGIVAAGALQRFGSAALVRSVAVAADHRGGGLGRAIVLELERLAAASRISQLVLLTQTAESFFARQGYAIIERSTAPEGMQASEEFRSLCPSSATCMAKTLPGSG